MSLIRLAMNPFNYDTEASPADLPDKDYVKTLARFACRYQEEMREASHENLEYHYLIERFIFNNVSWQ